MARSVLILRRAACRLSSDAQGAVAVLFAICILPIMGLIGAAVDYAAAARLQSKLQAALDAAAISASTHASGRTAAQVAADAQAFFAAQFQERGVGTPVLTIQVTNSTLQLTAQLNMPTTFLPLVGIPEVPIGTSSKTAWGITRLRVALALDNTGSMASAGKMTALQTATLNLLTQLQSSARTDGDVLVSVIPFAKVVNVGTRYRDATWIGWDGATVCSKKVCSVQWDGVIQDRDQNFDISNALPNSTASRFPSIASGDTGGTPVEILPLTSNWAQLRTTVGQMRPAGNTNQGIGLAWAWQTLTPGIPMNAPPLDPQYSYKNVIILLSDGQNTESRFYSRASQIDARQRLMCDAIKSAGIMIYTIQINTSGDPVSSVLRACASSTDKFVYMTTAAQLDGTLRDIGGQLTRLRLTN
ncbi:MAG: VWA domain-containing protein [Phreatobacter sp.]|uniref:vWA domain-containing protein n=1 Tax=Phreatobacter sp. TaxID=1966341 RepID=UPI001A59D8AB|nr:vWA domain-containing protein [Phreatobacter sp.]MBL8568389.1 VWA domain-containing protein [Phreatobacter sp.]